LIGGIVGFSGLAWSNFFKAAYPDPKPSADERPEPIMETNASDQQSSPD
jgi:hypothetical protein